MSSQNTSPLSDAGFDLDERDFCAMRESAKASRRMSFEEYIAFLDANSDLSLQSRKTSSDYIPFSLDPHGKRGE